MLAGIVVVESGERLGTTLCGGLLAALGAEVVLVKRGKPSIEHKWAYRLVAENGKTVRDLNGTNVRRAINGDPESICALLARADVVLLSTDLSSDDAELWAAPRPAHQILCDITAFGDTGPLAGRDYPEVLVQAIGGIADTTGFPAGAPTPTGAPFLDAETAVYSAAAIVAAMHAREKGGGQRISTAMFDVAVNALLTFIPLELTGRTAVRSGNRHPTLATWNAYRARDGWVLICAPTNDQWKRLCQAIERPDLADDPAFSTPPLRLAQVDAVDAILERWARERTVEQVVDRILAYGIAAGPIVRLADLPTEPNLTKRNMIRRVVDHRSLATVLLPACPIQCADVPDQAIRNIASAGGAEADARSVVGDRAFSAPALQGVRVVEIGMNTVAPLACRQLGALGADVIKIEPPAGDSNRVNSPLRADGESHLFAFSNTDKRGIVLDLRRPDDKAVLLDIIETADIVMENLKPGSLDRLGFGAETLCARFPRLIYCSVNGFGHVSAYPERPALDTVIQGMSGAMDATRVDGVPLKAGISVSDQLGGQFGLLAILAALWQRNRTGCGTSIDLAMQDCTAWATQTLWNATSPATANVLRCRDGYVVSTESSPTDTSAMTREEAVEALGTGGILAASVLGVREVLDHPQTRARGLLKSVPTADGSEWLVLESPLGLKSTPAIVRSAMPKLGFVDAALVHEFPSLRHLSRYQKAAPA